MVVALTFITLMPKDTNLIKTPHSCGTNVSSHVNVTVNEEAPLRWIFESLDFDLLTLAR